MKFKLLFAVCICFALIGCTGLGGLKPRQITMLKQEGFTYNADEGWSLKLNDPLLFGFDKIESSPESIKQIEGLSTKLHKYKLEQLRIVGYTDDIGQEAYNLKLSQQRAEYISSIFLQNGFKPINIKTLGRGSENPIVPNDSDENRANNRRVSIIIVP